MNFYVFRCVATFEYPSGVCPPSNPPNSARSAAPEEKPAPRKSHGVPEMALIVGHTTHESAWIWVRGSRNVRRLTVELRGVFKKNGESVEGCEVKSVLVYAERDYTDVVRFDRGLGLQPDMPYEVELTSEDLPTINGKAPAITGQLRTFSKADDPESFYFLHGSCNLPVDRMTALGSAAVGLLGAAATTKALELPVSRWDVQRAPWYMRWVSWPGVRIVSIPVLKFVAFVPGLAMYFTRFEQEKPLLPSPFEPILANALRDGKASGPSADQKKPDPNRPTRPAFMIHCGDQIYYDVDFPAPLGRERDYRRNYLQSWLKDEHAAQVLRSFPHYMTLDDHEIVDNFGTDPEEAETEQTLLRPALRAYHEYVGSRQPSAPERPASLYYKFAHGKTGFFVLDARTERSVKDKRIIGDEQLEALEAWLKDTEKDRAYDLKFIVSSVPFVAQLRPPGLDRNRERLSDKKADKWCGDAWETQRDRIICAICAAGVDRLVFLVGDMHCTYHARMLIGDRRKRITVHELAGGPLNQIQFAKRDDFYARYTGEIPYAQYTAETSPDSQDGAFPKVPPEALSIENENVLPWTSTLESFHGSAPSVLKISVTPETKKSTLEVRWTALRTSPARGEREPRPNFPRPVDPHDLCGRIRFHRSAKEAK